MPNTCLRAQPNTHVLGTLPPSSRQLQTTLDGAEWGKHTCAIQPGIWASGTGHTMPRRDSETAADALFIDAPTDLPAPRYAQSDRVGSLEFRQKSLNRVGLSSV